MRFEQRKNINKTQIRKLAEQTNLDPRIAQLLAMRNIDSPEKIDAFLNSDLINLSPPNELDNIESAAQLIKNVVQKKQTIVIYGDYDCDGIGAIAILYLTLKHLNADVKYYVPQRHSEGYGLNIKAINKIYNQFSPNLIITVDCGVTSVQEVEYAKSLGVEVVVTDHHERAKALPDTVIVNPMLDDSSTPYCGAGVAIKLAEQLAGRDYVLGFLDICAISTVADVVPLIKDNRIIVKHGLEMLSIRHCRPGL